jgi:hypothetical protein
MKPHLVVVALCALLVASESCNLHSHTEIVASFSDNQNTYGELILFGSPDTTGYRFNLQALQPRKQYQVKLFGGTCAQHGSSSTVVCRVVADDQGHATGKGTLLFRGQEHLSFNTFAQDDHVLVVESEGFQVCGLVSRQRK